MEVGLGGGISGLPASRPCLQAIPRNVATNVRTAEPITVGHEILPSDAGLSPMRICS